MCGLKHIVIELAERNVWSHPSWVCGLKQRFREREIQRFVTPFVGVWIETEREREIQRDSDVTPFVGVWIETERDSERFRDSESHTLRGCVD